MVAHLRRSATANRLHLAQTAPRRSVPWVEAVTIIDAATTSAETACAWIAAGGAAIGMGGWLIGDGQPADIRLRTTQVTAAVSES